MRYFITGHTGFKGAWLSLMLKIQGHEVFGYSLEPAERSAFKYLNLEKNIEKSFLHDIRDHEFLRKTLIDVQPNVIVHLAAQPLVIDSYENPAYTFETNVNGTLNILNNISALESLKMVLIVTSDKVYKNKSQNIGYIEEDELGGRDPYSASKSMADILTQSWIKSFTGPPISIVRAGNVIGGGDFSKDRLIPDLINNIFENKPALLRNPEAIRPWQHVLDCLNGYMKAINYSIENGSSDVWNFGPDPDSVRQVKDVVNIFENKFKIQFQKSESSITNYHEEKILMLDSSKAYSNLGWKNKFNFDEACNFTLSWYEELYSKQDIELYSRKHVNDFLSK
jgi:CDP-glucose 4,6-dehydratase